MKKPEEGQKTHRPKRYEYNSEGEYNSLNILSDKNCPALSQNYRQIISLLSSFHNPSLLDTYCLCHLMCVWPWVWSSISLSFGLFSWIPLLSVLRMVQSIFQRGMLWGYFFHISLWYFTGVKGTASLYRTHHSILAYLIKAVVWMIKILPLISNSSSLSLKSFGTLQSAPVTIGITVTLMFNSCFSSLVMFKDLLIFSYFLFIVFDRLEEQNPVDGYFFSPTNILYMTLNNLMVRFQ